MVQQSVSNEIGVKTYEQTYNYAVNKSIETMVKYLNQRGLDVSKLADQRELLERGIYAWMAGRHIKKIKVEVYNQSSGQLIERFDIGFEVQDPEDVSGQTEEKMKNKDFDYYWSEVQQAIADYDAPPEGADYRFLVTVGPNSDGQDPPDIEGWGTAPPKDDSHLNKQEYGDLIDTGNISGTFEFWR